MKYVDEYRDPQRAQALAREGHAGALDESGFAAELQAVRQSGISRVQDELHLGISGLAAPVFDGFGRLALVIAAIGPTASMQLGPASPQALTLKQATQDITREYDARLAAAQKAFDANPRDNNTLVARMKPGVTIVQARAELPVAAAAHAATLALDGAQASLA